MREMTTTAVPSSLCNFSGEKWNDVINSFPPNPFPKVPLLSFFLPLSALSSTCANHHTPARACGTSDCRQRKKVEERGTRGGALFLLHHRRQGKAIFLSSFSRDCPSSSSLPLPRLHPSACNSATCVFAPRQPKRGGKELRVKPSRPVRRGGNGRSEKRGTDEKSG